MSELPEQAVDNDNSYVDLHIHTTASDGTFTPTQVVKYSKSLGLKAIAITDHDSVDGIREGENAARVLELELIPGIEFSTEINDISVHIVGLYVDYRNAELLSLSSEIQNARENRAKKIIKKVNRLKAGPKITLEEIKELSNGLIGRPHIGEIMINKGYAKTMEEVFDRYLKRGQPCYVSRYKLTPQETIKFLKKIGAIPILAHPGLLPEDMDIEKFIVDLKNSGLEGIEVYYPSHSIKQKEFFKEMAEKYDLLESGGSDCHGLLNNGPFIGSQQIPYVILEKIKVKKGRPNKIIFEQQQ